MPTLYKWQETDFDSITQQYQSSRLPHGLMIVGHKGDGAAVFLTELVNLLLCQNPGQRACGHCKSCQLSQKGTHPDYLKVDPEGKSDAIKVDAIRTITHRVVETAQQSGNKVIHLTAADKMNMNAANALLKILEEPTDKTYLLLEASQISQMLPTIRSRCRIIHLNKPSYDQSVALVSENRTDVNADILLGIASGHPITAIELNESRVSSWRENEENFLKNQSFTKLSQYVAKQDPEQTFSQILLWTDTAIRLRENLNLGLASVSEGLVKSLAAQESVSLFKFRDYIVEKLAALQRNANLNAQLMAEELVSRWLTLRGNE